MSERRPVNGYPVFGSLRGLRCPHGGKPYYFNKGGQVGIDCGGCPAHKNLAISVSHDVSARKRLAIARAAWNAAVREASR